MLNDDVSGLMDSAFLDRLLVKDWCCRGTIGAPKAGSLGRGILQNKETCPCYEISYTATDNFVFLRMHSQGSMYNI